MSVYLYIDRQCQGQVATNFGWGNFTRYAESLNVADYHSLVQFSEHGKTNDVGGLADQVARAQREHPPSFMGVDDTLAMIHRSCAPHRDAHTVQTADSPDLGD